MCLDDLNRYGAFVPLMQNKALAELVGILLGDGSFYVSGYNNEVDIALDTKDLNYKNYVKTLLQKSTNAYVYEKYAKNSNCVHLRISRKLITIELLELSLKKAGNKINNKVTIPPWIWTNKSFIKACVRGLIDTDGSLYRLKPQWPNLFQLSFKNNDKVLLRDTRRAFLVLGFHPSRIFGNRIVVTQQEDICRYINLIGTKNDTHLKECELFTKTYC